MRQHRRSRTENQKKRMEKTGNLRTAKVCQVWLDEVGYDKYPNIFHRDVTELFGR